MHAVGVEWGERWDGGGGNRGGGGGGKWPYGVGRGTALGVLKMSMIHTSPYLEHAYDLPATLQDAR